jgi:hypothetical protein
MGTVFIPESLTYNSKASPLPYERRSKRLPSTSYGPFNPNQTIDVIFPSSDVFIDPSSMTFNFDVTIVSEIESLATDTQTLFQNNIGSIFDNIRIAYGSEPIDEYRDYGQLERILMDGMHASVNETGLSGTGIVTQKDTLRSRRNERGHVNPRLYSHGTTVQTNPDNQGNTPITPLGTFVGFPNFTDSVSLGTGNTTVTATRRYTFKPKAGLLKQIRMLPVGLMASQLKISFKLARPEWCMIALPWTALGFNGDAYIPTPFKNTYYVNNFDCTYDALNVTPEYNLVLYKKLNEGLPIPYSSFSEHTFNHTLDTSLSLIIRERKTSIKNIYAIIRVQNPSFINDSHATFAGLGGTLDSYQFRVGEKFFPESPVICSNWQTKPATHSGASEALFQLRKCLGILDDYTCEVPNSERWAMPLIKTIPDISQAGNVRGVTTPLYVNHADGKYGLCPFGITSNGEYTMATSSGSGWATSTPSSIFVMSTSFDGLQDSNKNLLSGLGGNLETEISLNIKFSSIDPNLETAFEIKVFVEYDALLLVKDNNVIQVVQ